MENGAGESPFPPLSPLAFPSAETPLLPPTPREKTAKRKTRAVLYIYCKTTAT